MAIVIYDNDCGFCRWCLAVLLLADRDGGDGSGSERGRPSPPNWQLRWGRSAAPGALRPLPLGTAEADQFLADLTADERASSWHLIFDAPSGATRLGAGPALAPTLSLLRGGRLPAALFARFPGATERGYRWVAGHRGSLGRFVPARARRWADRVIAAHGGPARPQ
jgi:predicted DCC family thiol-disulfide oxidoreductase YuxK